jgi:hypothetical protein
MSNYQMLRAVAIEWIHPPEDPERPSRVRLPTDIAWWDHFVEFIQDRYDSPAKDVQRARRRELPRFFYPPNGRITTSDDGWELLSGDYWNGILMEYRFFWRGLWEAGNRGRVVAEFQMEQGFGYSEDGSTVEDRFYLTGDGGGFYTICIDLTEDGCRCVVHHDDQEFYIEAKEIYQTALQEALDEEGVEKEEELEDGYFEWSPSEEIEEYYIHQRYDLISYPDDAYREMEGGFKV